MNNILLLSVACGIITAVLVYLKTAKLAYLTERPKFRLGICAAAGTAVFILCLQVVVAIIFVIQAVVAVSVIGGIAYLVMRLRSYLRR